MPSYSVPTFARPYFEDHDLARREWEEGAGEKWAQRNPKTVEEADQDWAERFGYTRTQAILRALGDVSPKTATWLEVGCGAGAHMLCMKAAGWESVEGVDVSLEAMDLAAAQKLYVLYGDALNLPHDDGSVDGIMTHGTLMAQLPEERMIGVLAEFARVARHMLCFFEVWQPKPVMLDYSGQLPSALVYPWERFIPQRLREHSFTMMHSHLYVPIRGSDAVPIWNGTFARLPAIDADLRKVGVWTMPRIP
jgi:hypothetical protein